MHLTCQQILLNTALQKVSRAVPTNSPLPHLNSIHLKADQDSLTVKATDLDFGIQLSIPAEVQEPGEILLPARLFLDLVRYLPPAEVVIQHLKAGKEKIAISSLNSRTVLNGLDPQQYPALPEKKTQLSFVLTTEKLQEAV